MQCPSFYLLSLRYMIFDSNLDVRPTTAVTEPRSRLDLHKSIQTQTETAIAGLVTFYIAIHDK